MAISLTEKAAQMVDRYKKENHIEDEAFLRVGATAGGCNGYSYRLEFDKAYDDGQDESYENHGVKFVVDRKSLLLLDGTTIDWKDGLESSGFEFQNPNVTRSCGCGSSFQV